MSPPLSPPTPPSEPRPRISRAGQIVLTYGIFATLWIVFSDGALAPLLSNPELILKWSVAKGLGFVFVTTLLLWFLVRRTYGTIEAGYHSLRASESAQRELAEQLQAERSRLVEAQAVARLGSWETDLVTLAVTWSEETHRIFGTDPATFSPGHAEFLARVHPDDRDAVNGAFLRSWEESGVREIDHRVVLPDGSLKHVVERWEVFRDLPGVPPRALGTCHDVTESREAEAEARHTATLLEAVVGSTGDAVFVKDLEGRYLLCNRAGANFIGLAPGEIVGRKDSELFGPEDASLIMERDLKVMRSGEASTGEEVVTSKGVTRTYLASKAPYRDARGEVIGLIGISRDITTRQIAEQQLRASENRFREMAENIGEIFYNYDPLHHRLLYASPAYERIWGRSREVVYADPTSYLKDVHPDDLPAAAEAFHRQLAGEETQLDFRIRRPDGELRWISEHAVPVLDPTGKVERIVGTMRDITEAKLAETRLTEQAALLDKARDAIIVHDLEHRILYWNRGAELLYGWPAAEAAGRSIRELLYQDPARFLAAATTTGKDGEWVGEIGQFTRDGRALTVEGRWTLVRDDAGRPRSILSINTDITGRKQLEAQFLRAQRMESIGTLAGGIAHDLNNVLAPVIMSVDLLHHRIADAGHREILSLIGSSARRGADMVGQILSFARGMEGRRVTVDVAQLLRDLMRIAADTFPKSILIALDTDDDLLPVEGDPTQLHQVLLNLCVNARDAMPEGGRLNLRATNVQLPAGPAGPHLRIDVTDEGHGIPAEQLERIFDPFFSTKDAGKGTGLGLSTAHTIVRSHGGFFEVTSQPGQGSTFSVCLPALVAAASAIVIEETPALPRGRGETVLVVDDEASIRHITRQALEAFGYEVLLASDGADAIETFTARRFDIDVVLTDMMMPRMDGHALIRELRCLDPLIPILGVSGLSAPDADVHSGVHFLPKPFTTPALLATLRRVLDQPVAAPDEG